MTTIITWDKADFKWDDNPHLWNLAEVIEVLEEVIAGPAFIGGGMKTTEENKKKVIRLVMYRKRSKKHRPSYRRHKINSRRA